MHFDGHGSLRTVTGSNGAVVATGNWEAYGQSAGGTGYSATPYQYGGTSGYRNDGDAGLLHIGARWYEPAVGRWISADSYLGDITHPLSRNRFIYCNSDPISSTDPSGHLSDKAKAILKFIARTGWSLTLGWTIAEGITAWMDYQELKERAEKAARPKFRHGRPGIDPDLQDDFNDIFRKPNAAPGYHPPRVTPR
jgi:RHS repeat-associated protein